ncbi:cupin domain-containing protein [Streptococcus uberis]|uniref:cupin domain-containing protein n=1 Tax=Streptococcus uberis TaxID=1349 RepID=UPI001FF269D5|nr:cupin domain-containing protein [Streptococcus uberis]MCK1168404.1 cupin domain-containing protein [Streptococcus uberis]MCK1231251.1 cupin domain-containing protein [Streptococcus uberis]MCK1242902.1 cupin domain-containing protein [Streptococcus uberis]
MNEELVKKGIFPMGEENPYGNFFIGQSYLQSLAKSPDESLSVGNVTFEPGCRNNWHVHLDGFQILLVTAGEGWYQEEGKTARKLVAGDTVVTNKGVKHWHGATKNSWFSHIAITSGKSEFYEAVTDEQYNRIEK